MELMYNIWDQILFELILVPEWFNIQEYMFYLSPIKEKRYCDRARGYRSVGNVACLESMKLCVWVLTLYKPNVVVHVSNPRDIEEKPEIQVHPWQHEKFKTSLECMILSETEGKIIIIINLIYSNVVQLVS